MLILYLLQRHTHSHTRSYLLLSSIFAELSRPSNMSINMFLSTMSLLLLSLSPALWVAEKVRLFLPIVVSVRGGWEEGEEGEGEEGEGEGEEGERVVGEFE